MTNSYATKYEKESMARAIVVAAPLSFKQSIEVCKFIRNRKYTDAMRVLENVLTYTNAVPYTRYNQGGTGHKTGIGPGRYPQKVTQQLIKLLKSAYANAGQKGLNLSNLVVKAAVANQGPKAPHYGRARGRVAKRTHIEIVLMQTKPEDRKEKKKRPVKTAQKEEKTAK